MDDIQRKLLESISIITDEKLKNLKLDYTKRGIVKIVNASICVVEIDGQETTCRVRNGIVVNVGDIVLVRIVGGNYSDKFIDCKLGEIGSGGSGEGDTYISSDFDHNLLQNSHNLTTDINHNLLLNYNPNEHKPMDDLRSTKDNLWSAEKIKKESIKYSIIF